MGELLEVEHRRQLLVEYCQMKLDVGDWHGVSDAANDLRELEVELKWLKEVGDLWNEACPHIPSCEYGHCTAVLKVRRERE
jgi:hypothetical protein